MPASLINEQVHLKITYSVFAEDQNGNPFSYNYTFFDQDLTVGNGQELASQAVSATFYSGGFQQTLTGSVAFDVGASNFTSSFSGTQQAGEILFTLTNVADESAGAISGATQTGASGFTPGVNQPLAPTFTMSGSATGGFFPLGFQPGVNLSQTVALTLVEDTNSPPSLTGDRQATLNEGATYTITAADLGYTDSDDGPADVTFTTSAPSNGTVLVGGVTASSFTGSQLAGGVVAFRHDGSETTSASFSVSVEDGNEDASAPTASTFNLTVNPVNDAPTASPVTLTAIAEDSGARTITTAQLLDGVTDVDTTDNNLTISSLTQSGNNGTLVNNGNGTWSYTPALNDHTSASFSYTVNDGTSSQSSTASLDITPVNDLPTGGVSITGTVTEDQTLSAVTSSLLDADGLGTLSYAWQRDSGAGFQNIAGATASTYSLGDSDVGASVRVVVSYTDDDGTGESVASTATAAVTNVNDVAVIGGALTANANEDQSGATLGQLTVTDADGPGEAAFTLQASTSGAYGTFTLAADGAYSYTLAQAAQALAAGTVVDDAFTVASLDGTTSTVTITVTGVNDTPIITSNGGNATAGVSVVENTAAVTTVTASDADAGAVLAYSISGGDDAALFAIDGSTGVLTFVDAPDFEVPGDADTDNVYDVIVSASDGTASDTQDLAVTVTDVDDTRPTATIVVADQDLAAGETSLVTITFSEAVTGFSNADLTAENATLSAVSSSDGGSTWTATLTPTTATTDATNLITLDNTGVADSAANAGIGTTDSNNYAVDTAPPTLAVAVSAAAVNEDGTSTVTFTFSEPPTGFTASDVAVTPGSGTITAFAVDPLNPLVYSAIFTPAADFDGVAAISVADGSYTDAALNTGTGNSETIDVDAVDPTLIATSPIDNAGGVRASADLTLTFDEAVLAGTGNLIITNASNGADTRTIDVTDATQVTFAGDTVTINPAADLASGATYNVTYAADVIDDASGNSAAALADPTVLNFTVASSGGGGGGTPPVTPPSTTPTVGPDNIVGTDTPETISAGESNDSVSAGGGNDTVNGNQGSDVVNGNQGDDLVQGGQDNDTVNGGQGNDDVRGDLGNDAVFGDLGNDTVSGGDGDDTVYGGQSPVPNGVDGADNVSGGLGNDIVNGNAGDDIVNGNQGSDTVSGGQGNDFVQGGQGDDFVFGDLGNDRISGDLGNDVLTGGAGADVFVFAPGSGNDVVTDFDFAAGDRLDFGGRVYTFEAGANGATEIDFGDGSTIILQGVTADEFNAGLIA